MKYLEKLKENAKLENFDFDLLRGRITHEELDSLVKYRPKCLNSASRLPGIRPSTLMVISYLLKSKRVRARI